MKRSLLFCLSGFLCLLIQSSCTPARPEDRLLLRWTVAPGNSGWEHTLTLINRGNEPLEGAWSIYYGSIAPVLRAPEGAPVRVEQVCGSHHRLFASEPYASIASGDSLRVTLSGDFIDMRSFYPEGAYLVRRATDGSEMQPCDIDLQFRPYHDLRAQVADGAYPTAERLYAANARFADSGPLGPYDIIPSLKSVTLRKGDCTVGPAVAITADKGLADEAALLYELLRECCRCDSVAGGTPVRLGLDPEIDGPEESYRMEFSEKGILLTGKSPHGVHNAVQSLLAILANKELPMTLPAASVADYPDLEYRGLHFDVARNFTPKEDIFRLIDLLSLYKMNILHLHLTDDEGWRLEVPGLEELTEVGARRGHTLTESDRLYPLYGSGWNPDADTPGSGYYSCKDFGEILRYAARHHIRVIPEIDIPGHSRAAIKAMNARYARYIATDPDRAREYLLADSCDASVYRSAQDYTDNVMNIAMPSAYRFVRKVLSELRRMYEAAGVELSVVHIGGDEVPRGAWSDSPICREFMARNGLADTHALKDHFVRWLYGELDAAGIQLAGWQEIVMLPDGRHVNRQLPGRRILSYGWNTQPGESFDEVPYARANAGYPVVLCNVTNLYLDLAYNKHHMEPGHRWGGYVDACSTFDMLPYDIYKSVRTYPDGSPADLASASSGKEALHSAARRNIVGIQGQLWAETIRNFDMAEYLLFPKMCGLSERAWNASPAWSANPDGAQYRQALRRYNTRIASVEMPRLAALGVNFRISPPGLKLQDGMLRANSAEPGATIRYTLDGSEPTEASARWTTPVVCKTSAVKARAYYCGRASVTSELLND